MPKYVCHHCGYPISNPNPGPDDRCPNCGWHLHVCANCRFFDGITCMLGEPYALSSAIRGNRCPRFVFRAVDEEEVETMVAEGGRSTSTQDVRIETIVAAVDGSLISEKIVAYAADLAKKYGAQVYLVYAYPPVPSYLGDKEFDRVAGKEVDRGYELLEPYIDLLRRAGIKAEPEVLEGPPPKAILGVAETRGADLIVLGSRGLGALRGLLLGSVSERVVRLAKCPVLIVR